MAGGLLAWFFGTKNGDMARWLSVFAIAVDLIIILVLGLQNLSDIQLSGSIPWFIELQYEWIPQLGISFHLAMDGLSWILLLLTLLLGLLSVIISWHEIHEKVGFFHFNLLWILAGIIGVFLAIDLFLFYFFWEVMLIPMYFLIGIWGHERRVYASYKFFIFTQASGLLMFISILGLYFIHGQQTGEYTFDYMALLNTNLLPSAGWWLMGGFLIAFLVKLPVVPLHTWLPDAHTEAPTAGSVILAGLLLKTGAYGLLRFVVPLFPEAARQFAPYAWILGVVSILYGAKLAFAQTDLKRLIAYTSVSHMGFVILGVFAFNELAYQGVVMQMITHGISTGALFMMAGAIQERIHTRNINEMGGFWQYAPKMGAVGLVFVMASLGLPGLGNFVAEFLVLLGTYQANVWVSILAATGLIASSIYALRIMQRVFYGESIKVINLPDFSLREMSIMGVLILIIVGLGLYPQPALQTVKPALKNILTVTTPYEPQQVTRADPEASQEMTEIKNNRQSLLNHDN